MDSLDFRGPDRDMMGAPIGQKRTACRPFFLIGTSRRKSGYRSGYRCVEKTIIALSGAAPTTAFIIQFPHYDVSNHVFVRVRVSSINSLCALPVGALRGYRRSCAFAQNRSQPEKKRVSKRVS